MSHISCTTNTQLLCFLWLTNKHEEGNCLFSKLLKILYPTNWQEIWSGVFLNKMIIVATLALGSRPRQGFARLRAKREAKSPTTYSQECEKVWGNEPSHPKGVPHWELESQWTPKSSEGDCRGQKFMAWGVLCINGKLLKLRYLKWARIAHLDI